MMQDKSTSRLVAVGNLLVVVSLQSIFGCSRPALYVGVGGKYNEARFELTKRRGGDIDKSIVNLEAIARENPTYRDSLTLLGRAYYKKGRYEDGRQILQRAVAVNKEDEIAWIVLGLAQMRLGDNERGLESIKGGLTLFTRASQDGYLGYSSWDPARSVKSALRRSIFLATKGTEEKENLLRSVENLLSAIDQEEFRMRFEESTERYRGQ